MVDAAVDHARSRRTENADRTPSQRSPSASPSCRCPAARQSFPGIPPAASESSRVDHGQRSLVPHHARRRLPDARAGKPRRPVMRDPPWLGRSRLFSTIPGDRGAGICRIVSAGRSREEPVSRLRLPGRERSGIWTTTIDTWSGASTSTIAPSPRVSKRSYARHSRHAWHGSRGRGWPPGAVASGPASGPSPAARAKRRGRPQSPVPATESRSADPSLLPRPGGPESPHIRTQPTEAGVDATMIFDLWVPSLRAEPSAP